MHIKEEKIMGLKSHNCHILLQCLRLISIRPYVRKEVSTAITQLSIFFQKICARILSISNLDALQEMIVLTLYKLERIFPPTFFDVMVHLVVHLLYETKMARLMHTRWMYPFGR